MCLSYYEILGVSESASTEEIKDIHKKLVLIYHPDKNPSPAATRKFKEIQTAYETLINQERRSQYDKSRMCDPIWKRIPITLGEFMHGTQKMVPILKKIYENHQIKTFECTLTIDVRAGMKAGAKYTFHNAGDILPGKKPGDVIFILEEAPNSNFQRVQNDLRYQTTIHLGLNPIQQTVTVPTTPILGYDMSFPVTLYDFNVNNFVVKRFPRLGFPDTKQPGRRGDLIVEVNRISFY